MSVTRESLNHTQASKRLVEEGLEPARLPLHEAAYRPAGEVSAAWRRGIMHAVERVDATLSGKGALGAKLAAVRQTLNELTELSRAHQPQTYADAFAVCAADHPAKRQERAA